MVSGLITVSFFVFFAAPFVVNEFYIDTIDTTKRKYMIYESLNCSIAVGMLCQPLIYVFLTKHFRGLIVKCILCQRQGLQRTSAMRQHGNAGEVFTITAF